MESFFHAHMAPPPRSSNMDQTRPPSANLYHLPSPPLMAAASSEALEISSSKKPPTLDIVTTSNSIVEEELSSSLSPVHSVTPEMSFNAEARNGFTPVNGFSKSLASNLFTPTSTPRPAGYAPAKDKWTRNIHPWTEDESILIRTWGPLVDAHGISWDWIAASKLQSRSGRQCADRWKTVKAKKTPEQVREISIKLEGPPTDIAPEMLPPRKQSTALNPEQYDELWELGLDKYRKTGVTWASLAERHSASWVTSTEHSGQAPAANICARWTSQFQTKTRQWKDGVFLYAVRPMGHLSPTQISTLDPDDLATWPKTLLARLEHGDKRKKGGASSLAAKYIYQDHNDDRSAKRQKIAASPFAANSNVPIAPIAPMYDTSTIEAPSQPSLHTKSIEDFSDSVHTTFTKIFFSDLRCDECKQIDHASVSKCQTCDAVFCQQCLESGRLLTHRFATNDDEDTGVSDHAPDIEMTDVSLAQRLQQEEEASPMRIKRERAAKTKALEQSRALPNFEDSLRETPRASPVPAKKSSPAKQTTKGCKYVPRGNGGAGQYIAVSDESQIQAPQQKPRKKQAARTASLEIRKKHNVSKRYVDGGSSSEFEEDEAVPSPGHTASRSATATTSPRKSNTDGDARRTSLRKNVPSRRGPPAQVDSDSDSDNSLISSRRRRSSKPTRYSLPVDLTDTSDTDSTTEKRRPSKIVKLKFTKSAYLRNLAGRACAVCFQAHRKCSHRSDPREQFTPMSMKANPTTIDTEQNGHKPTVRRSISSNVDPAPSQRGFNRDHASLPTPGKEDDFDDRGNHIPPLAIANMQLITRQNPSHMATTAADTSTRVFSPHERAPGTGRSSYSSGVHSKSQTPMSLTAPADAFASVDTDEDSDEAVKDAEYARAIEMYNKQMEANKRMKEEADRDMEDHKRREKLRRQEKRRQQQETLERLRQDAAAEQAAAEMARNRNMRLGIVSRHTEPAQPNAAFGGQRVFEWRQENGWN